MKLLLSCLIICLFPFCCLQSRQPYRATILVDDEQATVTAPNLVDLRRDLRTSAIEKLIPIYTPELPASLDINLRGILASGSFAANSTTFVVQFPQLGVTNTFTGGTREESLTLFKDFVRDAGTHGNLLKAYARFSPIDPIAGNPNSLMAQMGQADYLVGHLSPLSGCSCGWSSQPIVNQIQVGLHAGRSFAGGFDATLLTLPLRYSYSPDLDHAFILDAPLTYLRNGGASSLVGSIGIAYRLPILNSWSLTPIVRLGAGGSLDLCTSGSFISGGVTSVFNYKIRNYVFSLTDYVGYISSTNLWLTGINFNYHLHNVILKNGISLTSCELLSICGREVNFSSFFTDSYFARKRLYIRHYDEVGVSLIINHLNPCFKEDCLSIGFSYQFGQHKWKGYFLNFTYQF